MPKNPMAGTKPKTLEALSTMTIILQTFVLNAFKGSNTTSFSQSRMEFLFDSLTALATTILHVTPWIGHINRSTAQATSTAFLSGMESNRKHSHLERLNLWPKPKLQQSFAIGA